MREAEIKGIMGFLRDQRGQAMGLILKLGLAAIVLAIAITQVAPVIFNRIQVGKVAKDAAFEGAVAYKNSRGDINAARKAALKVIEDQDARLVGDIALVKDESGRQAVSVTVRKIRRTWLFYHVDFLAHYIEASATAQETINW